MPRFEAGRKANVTATYLVTHDRIDGEVHASPHEVSVYAGMRFPRCKGCGEHVHYMLLSRDRMSAQLIALNENFNNSVLYQE